MDKEYTEKTIICKDCKNEFTLSIGEQKFYDGKDLSYPIRCKECRTKRKAMFEKKREEIVQATPSKKAMTQDEIEAVLKKWRENTVYFPEKRKKGRTREMGR